MLESPPPRNPSHALTTLTIPAGLIRAGEIQYIGHQDPGTNFSVKFSHSILSEVRLHCLIVLCDRPGGDTEVLKRTFVGD